MSKLFFPIITYESLKSGDLGIILVYGYRIRGTFKDTTLNDSQFEKRGNKKRDESWRIWNPLPSSTSSIMSENVTHLMSRS